MGKMEQRCREWCEDILQSGEASFTIEWRKSNMWGHNPVIENWKGQKMVLVNGCGFDKESQAIVDLIRYIFPPFPEDGFNYGGHGVPTVIEQCKARGWELKKVASSSSTDTYRLRRM